MAKEEIKRNIEIIRDQIFRGWVAYVTAEKTLRYTKESNQSKYKNILAIVHTTAVESSLLALAKIFSQDRQSIQIYYLLNIIDDDLKNRNEIELIKFVEQSKMNLSKLQEIIDQLKTWRDKSLAHLDKLLANQTQIEKIMNPIDMGKIDGVYQRLEEIINTVSDFYEANRLNLTKYEQSLHFDWSDLFLKIDQ